MISIGLELNVLVIKRHPVTSGQRCNWDIVLINGRNLVLITGQNKVVADVVVVEQEIVLRQLAHAQRKVGLRHHDKHSPPGLSIR